MCWDLRRGLGRDWEFCKMRSKRDYGNRNRRVNKQNYKLDNNHKKSNKPKIINFYIIINIIITNLIMFYNLPRRIL